MGRGLSAQQRQVLVMCLNPRKELEEYDTHLLARDAIEALFPDLMEGYGYDRAKYDYGVGDWVETDFPPVWQQVWLAEDEEERAQLYRAKASVSRIFRRLEERNLVVRNPAALNKWGGRNSGIKLTDAGRELAESLANG